MASKTKKSAMDNFSESFKAAGVVMMAAAVTLGLVELPQEEDKRRAVVPARPAFELAANSYQQGSDPLRREREESGPHYISYGITQRSPGRTRNL
jgi:hypothetical protein